MLCRSALDDTIICRFFCARSSTSAFCVDSDGVAYVHVKWYSSQHLGISPLAPPPYPTSLLHQINLLLFHTSCRICGEKLRILQFYFSLHINGL